MKIKVRKDARNEFYAVLYAKNGKALWRTSESYKGITHLKRAIHLMCKHTNESYIKDYECYR